MIEKYISSSIVFRNHPVLGLNEKHKKQYLQGLGDLLSHLAHTNTDARRMYDAYCEEILGEKFPEGWLNSNKMGNSRKAQNLCREGFRFFRMSEYFWWDFFRIAKLTGIQQNTFSQNKISKACTSKSNKYCIEAQYFFNDGNTLETSSIPYIDYLKREHRFNCIPKKRLLVVGTMSAGKSTFINAIVGAKVAKVKTTACTSSLTSFHNRPFDDGVFYTKDEKIYPLESGEPYDIESENVSVHFVGALDFYPVILQDTPGIDYAYDVTHRALTENAIDKGEYDALCCIVNTPYVESDGEMEIINKVISAKQKKIFFILNQLDRFDPEDDSIDYRLKDFKKMLKSRKSSATVIPFSARIAMLLKREMSNQLSKTERMELETLKNRFESSFYDLWKYANGQPSKDDDYFARCGLTFLEFELLNNG